MINGISHITFMVNELERSEYFFKKIFDAEVVYESGENYHSLSKEKFLLINNIWIAIMKGESLNEKTYNHIAFKVEESDFDKYVERVNSLKLQVLTERTRKTGEGKSIYFYDYDNHLFEIHTGDLQTRLTCYNK